MIHFSPDARSDLSEKFAVDQHINLVDQSKAETKRVIPLLWVAIVSGWIYDLGTLKPPSNRRQFFLFVQVAIDTTCMSVVGLSLHSAPSEVDTGPNRGVS
jgi:hypothetical protein